METQLTEKAKENLERIAESRKKDSKFVRLEPGEKATLHFDPEKIESVDVEFEGKKASGINIVLLSQTNQKNRSTSQSAREIRR